MQISLSYASEDQELAEDIQLALSGAGHDVFFDEASLPPGGDYRARIAHAVKDADIFIFLISPNSVEPGTPRLNPRELLTFLDKFIINHYIFRPI